MQTAIIVRCGVSRLACRIAHFDKINKDIDLIKKCYKQALAIEKEVSQ
jgi:hypothetical protein